MRIFFLLDLIGEDVFFPFGWKVVHIKNAAG